MKTPAGHLKISIMTSPSAWGGMEGHTVELASTLVANGHDVSIFEVGSHFYGPERFEQKGEVRVIPLNVSSLRNPGFLKSFRILRKLGGDVCIFPKGGIDEGSWQFDLIARLLFYRYITIEHLDPQPMPPKTSRRHLGGLLPGAGIWWYRAQIINFLRSVWPHHVVCVSDAVRNRLIDCHRFPAQKVTTIHNGIDTGKFRPDSEYRTAFRNILGIPRDALVFGAIGRLNPVKGFGLALELFKELIAHTTDRDVWFVLVGNGPEHDALKSFTEESGLNDRVTLLGFTDKPWEIYPAFDVFLMPSRNEGLPLSLLESMACGCCPIAMGVGGIPEVINDPSLGWLVQPNDRRRFLEAMKEAVAFDPDSLKGMGKNARERVLSSFNAGRQFSAFADLIENESRGTIFLK